MWSKRGVAYRVESDKITHRIETSWNQAWNGTDQERFAEIKDNRLTLTTLGFWQKQLAMAQSGPQKNMIQQTVDTLTQELAALQTQYANAGCQLRVPKVPRRSSQSFASFLSRSWFTWPGLALPWVAFTTRPPSAPLAAPLPALFGSPRPGWHVLRC